LKISLGKNPESDGCGYFVGGGCERTKERSFSIMGLDVEIREEKGGLKQ